MKRLEFFDSAGNLRCMIPLAKAGKLSEAIWLSGQLPERSLCAGVGLCGRCKVKFLETPPQLTEKEKKFFNQEEREAGWRLACQHSLDEPLPETIKLRLPDEVWENAASFDTLARTGALIEAVLGVDLGTTSIAWKTTAANEGIEVLEGVAPNPQCAAGADVISRIMAAQSGKAPILRKLVIDWLGNLLACLKKCGVDIKRICVAANSVMIGILCGEDLTGLAKAPYYLSFKGGREFRLPEISCPLLLPPLAGPFIGGDITAGLLAIFELNPKPPFLLIDLGTNGELALFGDEKKIFFASVPMGPAMEGIGPVQGRQPGRNVATFFRLEKNSLKPHDQSGARIENVSGISATGYLSLLSWLKKMRFLAPDGGFLQGNALGCGIAHELSQTGDNYLDIGSGAKLFISDVEILLLVKAAFAAALKLLLEASGINARDITEVFMAGALGQFVNYDDLLSLGFFPQVFAGKFRGVGNASLAGACILARDPGKIVNLSRLCGAAKIINIAESASFQDKYLEAMQWRWL